MLMTVLSNLWIWWTMRRSKVAHVYVSDPTRAHIVRQHSTRGMDPWD